MKSFIDKLPHSYWLASRYLYGFVPVALRYNTSFRTTYNSLQTSQWWSKDKLQAYQTEELSKLLQHSYENVPYYRTVFDERKLKPRDIKTIKDLEKLPFLTKQIIREHYHDLIAKNISSKKLKIVKTSGSSGAPLSFYIEKKTDSMENAFFETMYVRMGYRTAYQPRVDLVEGSLKRENSLWEYDPAKRILRLSPRHLEENILNMYVDKIRQFNPYAIKSYPSTIMVLANFMLRNAISPISSVKVVLLGSEMLYPWQRTVIEKTFNSRVFSWYGQTENVILASECEKSNSLHIFPEYGITELVNKHGEQIDNDGEAGEIVGTGFNNYAVPFIRYRTGDVASISHARCSCGRNYPLFEKIEGRSQEYIVLRNGELVPLLIIPFSEVLGNVKQFQFYQDTPGELLLKIVQMPGYAPIDTDIIQHKLLEGLSGIRLTLEFTDALSTTESGKFLYMIQKLPINLVH